MKDNTHTVMVEDGANCTLRVRNTTSLVLPGSETEGIFGRYLICDDPIWFIDYTIFHGGNIATGVEQVEILTQHSSENEFAYFDRVPECYFRSLKDRVDTASFYTHSSPLNEAFHWLVRDATGYSECGREFFIERFALSVMNFAMNRNAYVDQWTIALLLARDNMQCFKESNPNKSAKKILERGHPEWIEIIDNSW
jgi:hypothetical protein